MKNFSKNILSLSLLLLFLGSVPSIALALYGDGCEQYGIMAYDAGGYCKCTAGYIFGNDYLGGKTCKLADLVCSDKYGIHSRYDILSNSCECSYGYVFGDKYGSTHFELRNSST